jgi:hypothetical protein
MPFLVRMMSLREQGLYEWDSACTSSAIVDPDNGAHCAQRQERLMLRSIIRKHASRACLLMMRSGGRLKPFKIVERFERISLLRSVKSYSLSAKRLSNT